MATFSVYWVGLRKWIGFGLHGIIFRQNWNDQTQLNIICKELNFWLCYKSIYCDQFATYRKNGKRGNNVDKSGADNKYSATSN